MASALRDKVILHLNLRGLSPATHTSYLHAMEELARFYMRPLDVLTCVEVQQFLNVLITVRKRAWSTVNVYFSAYRFLYNQVLGRNETEFSIPPRGRSGTRPGVLSREEVERLLNAPQDLKSRALLYMTYGSGLRVSEVVKVQPDHIDRGRMLLRIEQGKGHKDRYSILSARALKLLEEYWRQDGPMKYFFVGNHPPKPMSSSSALNIYNRAIKRSGVRRVGGIHVLRHCFATHLLEAGTAIHIVQKWMGHSSFQTTVRYAHMTKEFMCIAKSPLDI